MYLWRFPIELAAILATTVLLLVAARQTLSLRQRASTPFARGVWDVILIVECAGSAWVAGALIRVANPTNGVGTVFIDPGPVVLVSPAIIAGTILFAARTLFAARWRVMFEVWALLFLALNLIDGGNLGWSSRFGFPFAYYGWSDAMVRFNGQDPSPWSWFALAMNAITFAAVAAVIRGRKAT